LAHVQEQFCPRRPGTDHNIQPLGDVGEQGSVVVRNQPGAAGSGRAIGRTHYEPSGRGCKPEGTRGIALDLTMNKRSSNGKLPVLIGETRANRGSDGL